MSEETPQKTYPLVTPQVADMLGLTTDQTKHIDEPEQTVSSGDLPVANLPIVEDFQQTVHTEPSPTPHTTTAPKAIEHNADIATNSPTSSSHEGLADDII